MISDIFAKRDLKCALITPRLKIKFGDLVFANLAAKLDPAKILTGPYRVKASESAITFQIEIPNSKTGTQLVHITQIRKADSVPSNFFPRGQDSHAMSSPAEIPEVDLEDEPNNVTSSESDDVTKNVTSSKSDSELESDSDAKYDSVQEVMKAPRVHTRFSAANLPMAPRKRPIEKILGHQIKARGFRFRIKREGADSSKDEWIPTHELKRHNLPLLAIYLRAHPQLRRRITL